MINVMAIIYSITRLVKDQLTLIALRKPYNLEIISEAREGLIKK